EGPDGLDAGGCDPIWARARQAKTMSEVMTPSLHSRSGEPARVSWLGPNFTAILRFHHFRFVRREQPEIAATITAVERLGTKVRRLPQAAVRRAGIACEWLTGDGFRRIVDAVEHLRSAVRMPRPLDTRSARCSSPASDALSPRRGRPVF